MLPQLGDEVFLTDGGVETDLIFRRGLDLPQFASFVVLDDPAGDSALRAYFADYLRIGATLGYGLVLETVTWRASADWGAALGYDAPRLREVNRRAVELLVDLRDREAQTPVVVSGCIGPRDDAYTGLGRNDAESDRRYHQPQVESLARAGVDLVSALTITNSNEAVGIARAAAESEVPVVISFTVETDGALPTRMSLADAIETVDAATDNGPVYYMVNCAHPSHIEPALAGGESSLGRLRGVRANASRKSHAELDESAELDDGNPVELGAELAQLHALYPAMSVLGGCCGTDARHIEAIGLACRG